MILSPHEFVVKPKLMTHQLEWGGMYSCDLVFSSDEQYLLARSGHGSLAIWETSSRQLVFTSSKSYVFKATYSEWHGSFVTVAENGVTLIRRSSNGWLEEVLLSNIPKIDSEGDVVLLTNNTQLIVGTNLWLNRYDLMTRECIARFLIPLSVSPTQRIRLRTFGDTVLVRLLKYTYGCPEFSQQLFSVDGNELGKLSVSSNDLRVFQGQSESILAIIANADFPLALLDSSLDPFRVCVIRDFSEDMKVVLSQNGSVFAGISPTLFVLWVDGKVSFTSESSREPFSIYLANDGRVGVITYCTGAMDGTPNVTGVLRFSNGSLAAHSTGHVSGCPYAFSKTNRFFATAMTDSIWNCSQGIDSGTILLTKIGEEA